MDDNLLIDLVKSFPCLYDRRDVGYKNPTKKDRVWQHIADKMETDVNSVQRRWGNLRDRFGREVRKAPPPDGYDSDYGPPSNWMFWDRLQFLKGHILPRPRGAPVTNKIIRVNETSFKLDSPELMEAETKMEPKSPQATETQHTQAAEARSVSSAERDSQFPSRSQSPTKSASRSARSPAPKQLFLGNMDDNLLIDLVESCPCLYDHNDVAFRNADKKERVWQHIADKMGIHVYYVKRRWANLRDRFSRESRRAPPPDVYDSDFGPPKKWVFLDRMQFLKRHILQRPLRQRHAPVTNKVIRVNETSFKLDPLELMEAETNMEPTSSRATERQHIQSEEARSVSSAERDSHFRVSSPSRSERSDPPTRSPSPTARSPSPKRFKQVTVGYSTSPSHHKKGKKKASVDFGDVDKVMLETANIFQKLCEQKSRKPAPDAEISGFTTMIGAILSKLRTKRRMTVIQRCTEIAMQAAIEEEDKQVF